MQKRSKSLNRKSDKIVGFDHVAVRLYDPTISDNPAVSSGPSIGIDWTYIKFNRRALEIALKRFRQPFRTMNNDVKGGGRRGVGARNNDRNVSSHHLFAGNFKSCSKNRIYDDHDHEWHSEILISINDYEQHKSTLGPSRRGRELALSRSTREKRLMDIGYNWSEMASVVRETMRIQNSRRRNYHNSSTKAKRDIEEGVELAIRVIKRAFIPSKEQKKKMRTSYMYNEWKIAREEIQQHEKITLPKSG